MFSHLLAGCLVFWLCGWLFGGEITCFYLFCGSVAGVLPDILSFLLNQNNHIDKWSHVHRDNFSHSIFFPLSVFLTLDIFDFKSAIAVSLALLSHPILDLFGIGWGVKLFYPFSDLQFKPFHIAGKWAYTQEEIDREVEKFGNDNWFHDIFLTCNRTAIIEWGTLLLTLAILGYFCCV